MSKQKTVVCFGTGPAFKGGMSNYNTSLAKALTKVENTKVHIVSWLHQYPSIIPRSYKDIVSKTGLLDDTDISCDYITNYNNPFSYTKTAKLIASYEPDIVVLQWSLAIQGPPINRIIRALKKRTKAEIIIDLHFVTQKEKSSLDTNLTKMGLKLADSYIVHALKTFEELKELYPNKKFELSYDGTRDLSNHETIPVIKLFHPIYDLYKADPSFDIKAFKEKHQLKKHVLLFFGFIRKYKGLHHAIEAFKKVADQRDDVSFMICGELFWNTLDNKSIITKLKKFTFGIVKKLIVGKKDDEQGYDPLALIEKYDLQDKTAVFSSYVPNEDVHKYFQASNAVVLFYDYATPSGIESLSYNFELPVITTDVGHFPETIKDGENGYMAKSEDIDSMASTMIRIIDEPISAENIVKFKPNLSWEKYAKAILK